jgi:hypothetical protein
MSETKQPRTRTKAKKQTPPEIEKAVEKAVEDAHEVIPTPTPTPPGHILQVSDEKGLPLIYIGENFNDLSLESKITIITHLKSFITNQKTSIIKMVEDL